MILFKTSVDLPELFLDLDAFLIMRCCSRTIRLARIEPKINKSKSLLHATCIEFSLLSISFCSTGQLPTGIQIDDDKLSNKQKFY
jgi:hypothetical protein